jgi:hypothetical protein
MGGERHSLDCAAARKTQSTEKGAVPRLAFWGLEPLEAIAKYFIPGRRG